MYLLAIYYHRKISFVVYIHSLLNSATDEEVEGHGGGKNKTGRGR